MLGIRQVAVLGLGGTIVWSTLAAGTSRTWPLVVSQSLVLLTGLCWVLAMARARRMEWRRTALDLPLLLLFGLVLLQLVLGAGPVVRWALTPVAPGAAVELPAPVLGVGTVSPLQTWRSLGLFLTYGAVYVLTVNLLRTGSEVRWLARALVMLGGLLAFIGLLEYLAGETGLLAWGERRRLSRVSGPFINPDHFASWLVLLVMLGVGALRAGQRPDGAPSALRRILAIRTAREDLVRRYLPAISLAVMLLALVFTLSRGALVGLMGGVVFVLVLFGALGRARWSLTVVGALLAVVLGYASWIGLAPLVGRFAEGQTRWAQLVSSVPMLLDFPVLGVGLGAYRDAYPGYQPAALGAGRVYFPYAHNDLVQLVLELGPMGGVLLIFAVSRVARDLVFAHLLGRGRCPVGGGEGEGALRHDHVSTGMAVGALGAVAAFMVHSVFDFSARIPANGILGAACLGIATVALHTRFGSHPQLLTSVYGSPRDARRAPWLIVVGAVLVAGALTLVMGRLVLAETQLELVPGRNSRERVERVLRVVPDHPRALALRAAGRIETARRIWSLGLDDSGRTVPVARRRPDAEALARGAVADLRAAIAAIPTDPFLHEQLGWAYGMVADVEAGSADQDVAHAVTHFRRAIVLAPSNPFLHRALAVFSLTRAEHLLPLGLRAASEAVRLGPELLPGLVDRFAASGLTGPRWLSITPDAWIDRLQLGVLLERRGRLPEAGLAYRDAVDRAPPDDTVGLWLLARLLTRRGEASAAVAEADRALARDPQNPELHVVRAQALAAAGDPGALEAFRTAAERGDAFSRRPGRDAVPFKLGLPDGAAVKSARRDLEAARLQALVVEQLGQRVTAVRYRRLLGRYLVDRRLWDQAASEWDAILAATPGDAEAHLLRGQIAEALGDREGALAGYRQAVALDPRPAFRLSLARLLWDTEQYYQAMNEWRAVLETDPRNVDALLGVARGHDKEGDRLAAYHRFRRVLEIAPDNPVALREIARLTGKAR